MGTRGLFRGGALAFCLAECPVVSLGPRENRGEKPAVNSEDSPGANPEVKIVVRDHGPLLVEGPVRVVDAAGNEYPRDTRKPGLALCRCGASARRPFCDGSHKRVDFQAEDRADG